MVVVAVVVAGSLEEAHSESMAQEEVDGEGVHSEPEDKDRDKDIQDTDDSGIAVQVDRMAVV